MRATPGAPVIFQEAPHVFDGGFSGVGDLRRSSLGRQFLCVPSGMPLLRIFLCLLGFLGNGLLLRCPSVSDPIEECHFVHLGTSTPSLCQNAWI